MSIEAAVRAEAEFNEYARVVSKRIGELMARHMDPRTFLDADASEIRSIVATALAIILNELGQEAIDAAKDFAKAAGFAEPTEGDINAAILRSVDTAANRLESDLLEKQAAARKAASASGGSLGASFDVGLTALLATLFSDAAQAIITDLPTEINTGAALAHGETGSGDVPTEGGAGADDPAFSLAGLLGVLGALAGSAVGTWLTVMDEKVCDEDGNWQTSCLGRHAQVLPMTTWAEEGFPRDARLLCSRFGRPRCRCRLLAGVIAAPGGPVNVRPDVAKGRERGLQEELDFQPDHLDAAWRIVSSEITPLIHPNLWVLKIRVTPRVPSPAPVLAGVGR